MKVTMNKQNIKKLTQSQITALEKTANQMMADKIMSQEIPFDEGTLQNIQTDIDDSSLKQGKIAIKHDTPYAARLYYNPQYNFSTQENPNAKGEWWDDYLNGAKQGKPKQMFAKYLKESAGGVIK